RRPVRVVARQAKAGGATAGHDDLAVRLQRQVPGVTEGGHHLAVGPEGGVRGAVGVLPCQRVRTGGAVGRCGQPQGDDLAVRLKGEPPAKVLSAEVDQDRVALSEGRVEGAPAEEGAPLEGFDGRPEGPAAEAVLPRPESELPDRST